MATTTEREKGSSFIFEGRFLLNFRIKYDKNMFVCFFFKKSHHCHPRHHHIDEAEAAAALQWREAKAPTSHCEQRAKTAPASASRNLIGQLSTYTITHISTV